MQAKWKARMNGTLGKHWHLHCARCGGVFPKKLIRQSSSPDELDAATRMVRVDGEGFVCRSCWDYGGSKR